MKLYDDNPQSKAMQSLIHDTRNEGDVVRFHGNELRKRMKELKISDTKLWIHLEYVTGRVTEIEKAIDAYYERFSKDFPETDEVPYKPQVPDAYNLTLLLLGEKEWNNEMLPIYKLLKKLMSGYTLVRNNNLNSEWLEETPSPVVGGMSEIMFAEWIRDNYKYEKGKYRHLGDFYKNGKKLKTIKELHTIWLDETPSPVKDDWKERFDRFWMTKTGSPIEDMFTVRDWIESNLISKPKN